MGGDQKIWNLTEDPDWENNGKAAKSFKLECDIVMFILKGLCSQREKRWETARMDVVRAVRGLFWSLSIMLVSGTRKILKEIQRGGQIWKNQ